MKRRPKFVTVRWYDHHEAGDPWAEPKTPAELTAARIESRGWLISENDACIELSAHKPLDAGDSQWGRPTVIVKAAIYYRSDAKPVPDTYADGSPAAKESPR